MNVPHFPRLISYLLLHFRGFSLEDLPQHRRAFQQDDLKGAPLPRNNMSRPNGKSIYSMFRHKHASRVIIFSFL